ncbi:MAG: GFA family protein [Micropepsaceae bacterium]
MTSRPPIPQPPHKGGCLCGAVRFQLKARPLGVNACHCTDCKKLTGATNLLMVLAERGAFVHEQGAIQRYRKRADSGNEIDIIRCSACGVRMWHEPLSAPQLVFIAAGTLDDPSWVMPATHIWSKRASPGVSFQEDALVLQEGPQSREQLFDAFTRLYAS